VRDDELRAACFLALDALRAQRGDELPYRGALDQGFAFRGRRVPFLSTQKGIFRAAAQRGHAALAVQTSFKSPYDDAPTDDGFLYAYRAGAIDQPDNRALSEAFESGVPIVYFVGIAPGMYRPEYPIYVAENRPNERCVLLSPGRRTPSGVAHPLIETVERRYAVVETRARLHQARFRGIVLPAYRDQCAICRLKELRLLDAAHILPDTDPRGVPSVTNGISFCTIHHRSFDRHLVGIDAGYQVHVSRRLLEDEDGPMLALLKEFHGTEIELPPPRKRPDRELLAERYRLFLDAA